MSTPWIVLAVIVAICLYLKGYLKVPSNLGVASPNPKSGRSPGHIDTAIADAQSRPNPDELVKYGSRALGVAFAKAKRFEAEERLAYQLAEDAGNAIEETFTAPFSPAPAPPAGPPPLSPGA